MGLEKQLFFRTCVYITSGLDLQINLGTFETFDTNVYKHLSNIKSKDVNYEVIFPLNGNWSKLSFLSLS